MFTVSFHLSLVLLLSLPVSNLDTINTKVTKPTSLSYNLHNVIIITEWSIFWTTYMQDFNLWWRLDWKFWGWLVAMCYNRLVCSNASRIWIGSRLSDVAVDNTRSRETIKDRTSIPVPFIVLVAGSPEHPCRISKDWRHCSYDVLRCWYIVSFPRILAEQLLSSNWRAKPALCCRQHGSGRSARQQDATGGQEDSVWKSWLCVCLEVSVST